jgi:hypothetical protein
LIEHRCLLGRLGFPLQGKAAPEARRSMCKIAHLNELSPLNTKQQHVEHSRAVNRPVDMKYEHASCGAGGQTSERAQCSGDISAKMAVRLDFLMPRPFEAIVPQFVRTTFY